MEKISQHWTRLQNRLERIFDEGAPTAEEIRQAQKSFQLQTTPAYLSALGVSLPMDEFDRMAILFSRLMHVFEYGLLVTTNPKQSRPVAIFDHGILRLLNQGALEWPDQSQMPLLSFSSPRSLILQQKVRNFFPGIRPDDHLFFIRLSTHSTVVLGTTLAEPWLKDHLENIQMALAKALVP